MQHSEQAPRHLAVIMDGNGRWASARGWPRAAGHRAGAQAARSIVENARKHRIKVLTLFAFSSENWQRPKAEVRVLLDLFRRTIRREIADLKANGVRLHFIGKRSQFSRSLQADMHEAERETAGNDVLDLLVAVDYGGRWDIVRAARALALECAQGKLDPAAIDEGQLARHLSLNDFGQPDLFVRTGGERRISNFLLWDLAYSELFFTDTLWPDFDAGALDEAVAWYGKRERRFGRLEPGAASGS